MQPIQFFAARAEDGALLPGATVDVFVSGTSVRAEVFAKPDVANTIANPLTSDGNARVFFYTREPRIDIRIRRGGYVAPMMEGIVTVDPQDALLAAEAAVVRAEIAADAAQQVAQIKPDVATGLLETAEGKYFCVISPGVEEFLILYRKVAGIAVEMKRTPSATAITAVREIIDTYNGGDGSVALSFLDANRFTLLKLLVDGSLDMMGAKLSSAGNGLELIDANNFLSVRLGAAGSNINGLITQTTDVPGVEFIDDHRFIVGRLGNDRAFFGQPGDQAPTLPLPVAIQLNQQQRTDIKQVIEYGQSLSRGVQAFPAISLAQPYQNIMLASGVKVRSFETAYDASAFVPLVEVTAGTEGETPVAGICNGVTRRAVENGEAAANWVMAGMAPGRSGAPVERLSPAPMGNGDYEAAIKSITDCKRLADAQGKTYSVWAYSWTQGESNYLTDFERSPYQYMQYQLALFDKMTDDVVAVTGQKFRPYLFSYQVGAHRKYGRDAMPIALTQWRVSRERDDVVIAVPVYMFPVAADNLHLTNEASWLLGEYKSRALYETMIKRTGKWRPLEPVAVEWTDSYVDVRFHVPRGELVLDAALTALTRNFGFDVREGGAVVADLITGVAVHAPDTVRISLLRPAAGDAVLTYARGRVGDFSHSGPVTGARGNLRDTHGLYDTAVSPLGNTFALHNPCVMFEYNRKTGF